MHLMMELAAGRHDVDHGDVSELVRGHLTEDLAAQLTVAEVARRVNMSTSHMSALFRPRTGYSPMAFRTLKGMQRARELLDTPTGRSRPSRKRSVIPTPRTSPAGSPNSTRWAHASTATTPRADRAPARPPCETVAMRLASSWSDDIAASVGWLGDDAARFDEPLAGVRAAAGAVAPSGEAVTAARVGLVAPDLAPLLATLVSEHDAWAAGDADRAKLMRLAQHSQLRSLTDPLRDWCLGADAQASCAALAATARVLLLALSIETGRDFEARFRPRFNLLDLLRDA